MRSCADCAARRRNLAGCCALAQSEYLRWHNNNKKNNAVLKILFFEILYSLDLIDSVPPWYSPTEPVYENDRAQAYWDVSVYASHDEVRANRIDARIVHNSAKTVIFLRLELKRQFQGFQVKQFDILMDVLVGYSKELESTMRTLTGSRSKEVLLKMQKTVLSSSLSIARLFKVMI